MRSLKVAPLLAALLIIGCGGHRAACNPPIGHGTLGVCAPKPPASKHLQAVGLAGRFGVDVSSYQGVPNWSRVGAAFVIIKAREGTYWTDPTFRANALQLNRLHRPWGAYLFLRPGACGSEGGQFARMVDPYRPPLRLWIDAEVPMASDCAARALHAAEFYSHQRDGIYTGPGTWPGGPHGDALLWVATYGSRPGCVWTCSHVSWQFTDGQAGPGPHGVPGLAGVDTDLDTGMLGLAPHPKPVPPQPDPRLKALYAYRAKLRALLQARGCRRRAAQHQQLGPKCTVWFAHGRQVNARIRQLGGH